LKSCEAQAIAGIGNCQNWELGRIPGPAILAILAVSAIQKMQKAELWV
jgi:hypothetical protein